MEKDISNPANHPLGPTRTLIVHAAELFRFLNEKRAQLISELSRERDFKPIAEDCFQHAVEKLLQTKWITLDVDRPRLYSWVRATMLHCALDRLARANTAVEKRERVAEITHRPRVSDQFHDDLWTAIENALLHAPEIARWIWIVTHAENIEKVLVARDSGVSPQGINRLFGGVTEGIARLTRELLENPNLPHSKVRSCLEVLPSESLLWGRFSEYLENWKLNAGRCCNIGGSGDRSWSQSWIALNRARRLLHNSGGKDDSAEWFVYFMEASILKGYCRIDEEMYVSLPAVVRDTHVYDPYRSGSFSIFAHDYYHIQRQELQDPELFASRFEASWHAARARGSAPVYRKLHGPITVYRERNPVAVSEATAKAARDEMRALMLNENPGSPTASPSP